MGYVVEKGYVLVTGASAGIGVVFAKQLASHGCDLILTARRQDRLDTLAQELRDEFSIKVETLSSDLADPEGPTKICQEIEQNGWELAGLINNAGFGARGEFETLTLEHQLNMIQVNITSLVDLSHRLLPTLKRNPGAFIINVASTAAFQAGPHMAVYYATKAFVLSFSEALHEELKGQVAVSALCPGPTESEFGDAANMTDTKLFKTGLMSAEDVVRKALNRKDSAIVVTGWKNKTGVVAGKVSPRWMTRKLSGWLQA